MTKVKRDMQFSILYFIGIILIVANHVGGGGVSLMYNWFPAYSFHLGLFMFCSGYFFINNKNKSSKEIIKKKIKKLIIPLYVWNLVYGIIITILHQFGIKFGGDFTLENLLLLPIYDGHQFILNLAAWYIPTLFLVEIINIPVLKFLNKKNDKFYYLYFILSILIGFLGVHLAMEGYNKEWWLLLVRMLYFIPFFALGMLYKVKLQEKDTSKNTTYFSIVLILTLITIYMFGGTKSYTPSWCSDFDNIYRPFITGFLGIAFWLRMSKVLIPILKDSKLVSKISNNTFAIMMHHITGFFLLNTFFAFLAKFTNLINNFDFNQYVTTRKYLFLPKNLDQFEIIYVVVGIAFSLLIVNLMQKIKNKLSKNPKLKFLFE